MEVKKDPTCGKTSGTESKPNERSPPSSVSESIIAVVKNKCKTKKVVKWFLWEINVGSS